MKLLVILIGLCSICLSCQQKADVSNARYIKDLVEIHKLTLPVDENTYYLSKSIFQFEENEFFNEFVEMKNIAQGDRNEFWADKDVILTVAKVSGDHHDFDYRIRVA